MGEKFWKGLLDTVHIIALGHLLMLWACSADKWPFPVYNNAKPAGFLVPIQYEQLNVKQTPGLSRTRKSQYAQGFSLEHRPNFQRNSNCFPTWQDYFLVTEWDQHCRLLFPSNNSIWMSICMLMSGNSWQRIVVGHNHIKHRTILDRSAP